MKLNKRQFLFGASASTIIFLNAPAFSYFPHGIGFQYPTTFQGNPNAVFTAIDTSGGIVMSRTSGYCVPANPTIGSDTLSSPGSPAFVQVSASAITATGTISSQGHTLNISALSDLEFSWNFGDNTGNETITNPATGQSVNANSGQTGGEAAYSYRTTGAKTITLYIRGKNGSGGYITATVATTFTVNDLTAVSGFRARYVDFVNGDDAYDGTRPQFVSGTIGPKKTLNSTTGLFKSGVLANNSCSFLAKGSTWQDQGNINLSGFPIDSHLHFTSYTGATPSSTNPKIANSSTTTNSDPINVSNGSSGLGNGCALTDIVISHIDTETNKSSGIASTKNPLNINGGNANDPSASMTDIYLDNCSFKIQDTQDNSFTGSISGNTLTVSGITGTAIIAGQAIWCPGNPGVPNIALGPLLVQAFGTGGTTGTGGNGTYTLSGLSQTVTSRTMSSTIAVGSFLLGCPFQALYAPFAADSQRCGSWNCNYDAPQVGGISLSTGLAPKTGQWFFFVGGRVTGDGTDNTRDHSIYLHGGSHTLFRWADTTPLNGATQTFGRNYSFNTEMDWLPDAAYRTINTSCNGKIPTAGAGAGSGTTLTLTGTNPTGEIMVRPVQVGMFVFSSALSNIVSQITALLQTTISSITWSGGTATLTTSAAHSITTGRKILISISGATPSAYNGDWPVTSTGTTTMTFPMPNNPGGSASVPGVYTGSDFTITPASAHTIPQVLTATTGFTFAKLSAAFIASYDSGTQTATVTAGTTLGTISAGDACLNMSGNAPLIWGPIASITGSPATSFVVTVQPSFTLSTFSARVLYTVPFAQPTVVDSVLIDGCKMATTFYGHAGNSSNNNATYLKYTNYVCQNSAFVNLQTGGALANCLETYTMRNNRAWGTVAISSSLFLLTSSTGLDATANWRCYGNYFYYPSTSTGKIYSTENQTPTGTLPQQITDNKFWNAATSAGGLVGSKSAASGNAFSLMDRNAYNQPGAANIMTNAPGTPISFASWQALGANYDPNSTNVNNATPTGAFSAWTVPPTQWSDFGP